MSRRYNHHTLMTTRTTGKVISFGPLLLAGIATSLLLEFMGEVYPDWIANPLCFRYLGCNAGFLGYDALIHFCSGIAETLTLFWAAANFSKFDMFRSASLAQSVVYMLGIIGLISIGWELIEFSYDGIRMVFFHINLLVPNTLSQPSNADTVGDLVCGLVGALFTLVAVIKSDRTLLLDESPR